MPNDKRGPGHGKWPYVTILVLVAFGAAFIGGVWFAGRDSRAVRSVVKAYSEAYAGSDSTKDVSALMPLYADKGVFRDAAADRSYQGAGEIKTALDSLLATPRFDLVVDQTSTGGDWAVVRWTANGTSARSGRLSQVAGVTVLEISKGRIERETWYYDPAKAPF